MPRTLSPFCALLVVSACSPPPASSALDAGSAPDATAAANDAGAVDAGNVGHLVLVGGGSEVDPGTRPSWSEAAYGVIVEHAAGRAIVVLAESDLTEWIPDYFKWLGASDAFNVKVDTRALADDPQLAALVDDAGAVFIKGGDQWRYVSNWRDTALSRALRALHERGGVLAGTSAGAHVLSELVFDARNGSLYPEDAIRDARHERAVLTDDFLGIVPRVLVDTHVTARGRQARMAALLARYRSDHPGEDLMVLGLDEQTALIVDNLRHASIIGPGVVTLMRATGQTVVVANAGAPPVATQLRFDLLGDGSTLDLQSLAVTPPAGAQAPARYFSSTQAAPVTLAGSDAAAARAGSLELVGEDTSEDALARGMLTRAPADGVLPGGLIVTHAFDDSAFTENRMGGLLWAISRGELAYGVLIDSHGGTAAVDAEGVLRATGDAAILVVDVRAVSATALTPYTPRQSATLIGATLHLLHGTTGYRTADGFIAH